MSNNRTHLLVQLFLLNNVKMDDDPLPEPTVAPFNSHPVDVDMSVIPIETVKLTSIDDVLVKPPPDVQKLFNEVFHFSNSTTVLPSTISSINENLTNSTQGLNNTTLNGKVNYDPAQVNLYTILALVLVIVTLICFGIIMWCRKNKLRTEKRNQYPVFSVTNSEYISPKSLNNEKIKNVP
ncbi:uncharacterized protein [Euwallacea fornicatus]|uniref:uncharacterized protein isoform X2 n=1 Tax=Euwallacea fornicatus TaxID=995702 RepID=UPI003390211C